MARARAAAAAKRLGGRCRKPFLAAGASHMCVHEATIRTCAGSCARAPRPCARVRLQWGTRLPAATCLPDKQQRRRAAGVGRPRLGRPDAELANQRAHMSIACGRRDRGTVSGSSMGPGEALELAAHPAHRLASSGGQWHTEKGASYQARPCRALARLFAWSLTCKGGAGEAHNQVARKLGRGGGVQLQRPAAARGRPEATKLLQLAALAPGE